MTKEEYIDWAAWVAQWTASNNDILLPDCSAVGRGSEYLAYISDTEQWDEGGEG